MVAFNRGYIFYRLQDALRNFSRKEGFIQTIEVLYKTSSSADLLNSQAGDYFKTSDGVRRGYPILFNFFFENIMQETLQDFQSTISIVGRIINNSRFTEDVDLLGGSNSKLQGLTNRLTDRAEASRMEVNTEKSKVLINSTTNTRVQIFLNGEKLEEEDAFKYLAVTLIKDGRSTTEIKTVWL